MNPGRRWLPLATGVLIAALLVHGALMLGLRLEFGVCPNDSWPSDPGRLEGVLGLLLALDLLMSFAAFSTPALWLVCAWAAVRNGAQKRQVNLSGYVYLAFVAVALVFGAIVEPTCVQEWLDD